MFPSAHVVGLANRFNLGRVGLAVSSETQYMHAYAVEIGNGPPQVGVGIRHEPRRRGQHRAIQSKALLRHGLSAQFRQCRRCPLQDRLTKICTRAGEGAASGYVGRNLALRQTPWVIAPSQRHAHPMATLKTGIPNKTIHCFMPIKRTARRKVAVWPALSQGLAHRRFTFGPSSSEADDFLVANPAP